MDTEKAQEAPKPQRYTVTDTGVRIVKLTKRQAAMRAVWARKGRERSTALRPQ